MIRFANIRDEPLIDRLIAPSYGRLLGNINNFALLNKEKSLIICQFIAPECEIIHLVTDPDWQRQGLARQLLRCVQSFVAKGTIFLEVSAHNQPALALYAEMGFVYYHTKKNYYAVGDDALLYKFIS